MRADFLFILPAVIIALIQTQIIWRNLPLFQSKDTEIEGKYKEYEAIWFRNAKYAAYFLFAYQFFFPLLPIIALPSTILVLKAVGYIFVFGGFLISYAALKILGNNWSGMLDYRIKKDQLLQTHGIYKKIRHPIYLAVILEIVGYELLVTSWLLFPLFFLSFYIFARHILNEDALLEKKFGETFIHYKKQTKAFLPGIY